MQVQATTQAAFPARYLLDQEHGGLRTVVLLLFIVIGAAAFFISGTLIQDVGLDLLSILIGLIAGAGAAYLGERILKRIWPSGRVLAIDADGVRLQRRAQTEANMRADQPVTALLWTFKTPRRSKVPKGWALLACALEQDDIQLTVYTLMSPRQFDGYQQAKYFQLLKPRSQTARDSNPLRVDFSAESEQRRLREAENLRWLRGAEMQPDDFIAYIDALFAHFPDWMPRH